MARRAAGLLLLLSLIPLREVSAMASTTASAAAPAPLGGPWQQEMVASVEGGRQQLAAAPTTLIPAGHAHHPYHRRYTIRGAYTMHTQQGDFGQWRCCDPRFRCTPTKPCHPPLP
uniref:Uncharacterized protein n=1 Tax=Oryza brachyantha TaxID=4533 RepID=J3NC74_ORYBR